jgi:hypothetical protein
MGGFLKKLFGGGEDETADQAQDMAAKAGMPQDAMDQASGLMEGGMPDVAEVKAAVDKLSPEELQSAAQEALEKVPANQRAEFGQAIQSYANNSGGQVQVPSGVASGNTTDLASAVSGLLKGGGGLGSLASVFGGGGNGAAAGGSSGTMNSVTSAVSSMTGGTGSVGGFDIAGLLNNPLAKTVLAALIPAIMKAASGK